jgi:hypothetical protein
MQLFRHRQDYLSGSQENGHAKFTYVIYTRKSSPLQFYAILHPDIMFELFIGDKSHLSESYFDMIRGSNNVQRAWIQFAGLLQNSV